MLGKLLNKRKRAFAVEVRCWLVVEAEGDALAQEAVRQTLSSMRKFNPHGKFLVGNEQVHPPHIIHVLSSSVFRRYDYDQ